MRSARTRRTIVLTTRALDRAMRAVRISRQNLPEGAGECEFRDAHFRDFSRAKIAKALDPGDCGRKFILLTSLTGYPNIIGRRDHFPALFIFRVIRYSARDRHPCSFRSRTSTLPAPTPSSTSP